MVKPLVHKHAADTGRDISEFEIALDFFRGYGLTPDPWQELVLKDWVSKNSSGKWAHSMCGLSVPRQNGKSLLLELRIIYGLIFLGEKILFASHEVRSSDQIFNRLSAFFENQKYPEIQGLLKNNGIRRANGQQAIYLENGGSVQFIARTKGGGRGFTVDALILDECQQLNDDAYAALLPTISAAPQGNPQTVLVGTPPADSNDGAVFTKFRSTASEADATVSRLSWIEFSAAPDDDPDDEDVWYAANPSLASGRMDIDSIRTERGSFAEDIFYRERLGVWGSADAGTIIPVDVWQDLWDEHSTLGTRDLVLAVDISPNRGISSIVVAGQVGKDDEERIHIEGIENKAGTGWVLPRVIQLVRTHGIKTVVIDAAGPAATLIDDLHKARVKVATTQARDMAIACGQFLDSVHESTLVHLNQPYINIAVSQARKRRLGDAFAWARSSATADITPLVAATLALWGVKNSKVKKAKNGRSNAPHRKVNILR
ncbi:phage terminase family protein [Micrococcus luteus]|nr:phage terminase family protein [Micrococcus luteus]